MATPLINGINYSWASVKVVLFGVPVVGITKISYNAKQKKENNYGAGSEPVSRGYGNIEYEGSIEIYLDEWKRIIAASFNRNPLSIPPFDIQVLYGANAIAPDQKDVLKSVEFLENPLDISQGDTKTLVTIPLIIAGIER
jgi:hypothetical protein